MNFLRCAVWMSTLSACGSTQLVCDKLISELQQCGFTVTELRCDGAARADLERLAERFGERDCAAFSTAEGAADPRLCALANWKCPEAPLDQPVPQVPQGAVVLVSGIDGSPAFDWNPNILESLKVAGISAHHVSVLPWATVPERTNDLWFSLRSLHARVGQKMNLVCYAVGGLDCRYLVSPGGLFADNADVRREVLDVVASVTTIATPHRGTQVADAARAALQDGTADEILSAWVGDGVEARVPDDAQVLKTLEGLSPQASVAFNEKVIDASGLPYFSWAGVSHLLGRVSSAAEEKIQAQCAGLYYRHADTRDGLNPLLWSTVAFSFHSRLASGRDVASASDGMVAVESAKWGQFQGCVPADHYDVVGEIGHSTRDPMTGFDARHFVRHIADGLARSGL